MLSSFTDPHSRPLSHACRDHGDAELHALPPTFPATDPYPSPPPSPVRVMAPFEHVDFPEVGGCFLDFQLESLIGQGAFARVYLARQQELGNRQVVLKLSTESAGEINVLAQLLHSNIVPVYSVHSDGPLHAVCMPYLGTATLADVLRNLRAWNLPDSGKYLVKTLQEHRSTDRSSRRPGSNGVAQMAETSAAPASALADVPKPATQVFLEQLQGLSYVDAVLWLAWQLSDGLAHAHERGI